MFILRARALSHDPSHRQLPLPPLGFRAPSYPLSPPPHEHDWLFATGVHPPSSDDTGWLSATGHCPLACPCHKQARGRRRPSWHRPFICQGTTPDLPGPLAREELVDLGGAEPTPTRARCCCRHSIELLEISRSVPVWALVLNPQPSQFLPKGVTAGLGGYSPQPQDRCPKKHRHTIECLWYEHANGLWPGERIAEASSSVPVWALVAISQSCS